MNLLALTPLWLAGVLVLLLIAAAVEDAARLRISNLITLGVIAAAIAALVIEGPSASLWQNAVVFAGLLVGGTLLFGMGKMGGGDVKLIAAVGLWCDFTASVTVLASIFVTGGVLALLIIGARSYVPAGAAARFTVLQPKQGIPYGVAVAVGTIVALIMLRT